MRHLVIMLLIGLQSCGQATVKLESFSQHRGQITSRDSLFVLHTVKELSKLNWYSFEDYSILNEIGNDQVEYFIGAAFYNTDSTKMIVWFGEKKPNALSKEKNRRSLELNRLCPMAGDTIYSATALIGIRDSSNSIWKIYPFNQQQAGCYESKESALKILDQYYFHQMAGHEMYRMQQSGDEKGNRKLEAYGYNLQDEDFWEKCWLWQKDNLGSNGLYPFQIKGYRCDIEDYNRIIEVYPDRLPNETNGEYLARNGRIVKRPLRDSLKECAEPFELPEINYPKEILDLYGVN